MRGNIVITFVCIGNLDHCEKKSFSIKDGTKEFLSIDIKVKTGNKGMVGLIAIAVFDEKLIEKVLLLEEGAVITVQGKVDLKQAQKDYKHNERVSYFQSYVATDIVASEIAPF